ncbi:tRNA 2-selenouridine synthase-like [Styela clava]
MNLAITALNKSRQWGSRTSCSIFINKVMSETAPISRKNHFDIRLPYCYDPFNHGQDEVIDVRTPNEYAEDHIPGSINLPVLTNDERHEVGKEYADNSFLARRIGASLISNNIATIIKTHFSDKPKTYSCLIYCWRGGQRSKSLSVVLNMIGYDVKFLSGGYKTYRKEVISLLSHIPSQFSYNIVSGMTGCGKTLLLDQLREAGEQVLDLEALAKHKGSVLGINCDDDDQPSTKMFESQLLHQFSTFDSSLPVWVEAEGRVIGNIHIPDSVFQHIQKNVANVYVIQAPLNARVKYLLSEYMYWTNNPTELKDKLGRLSKHNLPLKKWYKFIDESRFEDFVADILKIHYDPSYIRSRKKTFSSNSCDEILGLEDVTVKSLANVAQKLLVAADVGQVA